jgi:hypothetical protein
MNIGIVILDHIRKVMRSKWTDGHRIYFSVEENGAIVEMPSVDLVSVLVRKKNWLEVLYAYADLEYIAGYWK